MLCASNDWRNPRVSNEELCRADYIFSRTFDVAKLKIEERFPEKIAGVKGWNSCIFEFLRIISQC